MANPVFGMKSQNNEKCHTIAWTSPPLTKPGPAAEPHQFILDYTPVKSPKKKKRNCFGSNIQVTFLLLILGTPFGLKFLTPILQYLGFNRDRVLKPFPTSKTLISSCFFE